ncbi:MAG: ammonium transporter, partial [Gammaproteobacteria bacterium]|nr:ammonium transporter [Gammaproteobacteria bacterium]
GLVRSKNVLSVLMQCFAITCLASLVWLVFGYSFAFSDGGALNDWLGGISNLFLGEVSRSSVAPQATTIPETVFVMFQMTFAIITPALVVGGFAERMKFSAMIWFSVLWLVVVYLPVCHWVWGGGWLGEKGVLDFAGGLVVHLTAGAGAIVAAIVLGNRKGFPRTAMPPHNLTMSVTGAGMLWVGWFGFNAGSAVAASGDAGMAMLVTHISAATGSLVWMFAEWIKYGKPSVLGIVTGMVAGLGTITPASGFVGPMGALIIGASAGIICFIATNFIKRVLRIDDSLDVFPVHGVGGILGTILAGVFVAEKFGGVGLAEGMTISSQVGVQIQGVLAVLVWTVVATFIILKVINIIIGIRVDEQDETQGLDVTQHEETGYNM